VALTRGGAASTFLLLVAAALLGGCRSAPQASTNDGPALVVMMVVDQLTPDLLDRYDALFTGGLRRLTDGGYKFVNATHDHSGTETAPGHTTLSTGVYPTRHTIVGNQWNVRIGDAWRSEYCFEDLARPIVGYPDLPGRSPRNIARSGLPDWMVARDPDTRVVSISRKDRGAIGLAAQTVGDVYWLVERSDGFVTSDFYRSELPSWVRDFNATRMPALYSQTVWESTVPADARSLTRPDTSQYEQDRVHTAFPHLAGELVDMDDPGEVNSWRYTYTPFPDAAVLALAAEAVRTLSLGGRDSPDYLGVSLSQTDLVGHYYGPGSREQLDNLLRLDAELGRFLTYLDEAVGAGRWVLAVSADHGVLEIPEELVAAGGDAARLTREDRAELLEAIAGAGGNAPGFGAQDATSAAVVRLPFIEATYTFDAIESGQRADSFAVLYANSHSRTRIVDLENRAGIYARYRPQRLLWGAAPATHGSPYYYDRHVPLIFLGGGIPAGTSTERVATVDVAPTMARLAGIPAPGDLDGRDLNLLRRR